jgi:hypothetical protein
MISDDVLGTRKLQMPSLLVALVLCSKVDLLLLFAICGHKCRKVTLFNMKNALFIHSFDVELYLNKQTRFFGCGAIIIHCVIQVSKKQPHELKVQQN